MLDHIGIGISDYARSKAFYEVALKPLNYTVLMEFAEMPAAGFGVAPKPDFWMGTGAVLSGCHIAFRANNRAEVDAFYKAALEAGGKDNGAPGPRPHYHPNYYGAFVYDPDGYNVEAVCHNPE